MPAPDRRLGRALPLLLTVTAAVAVAACGSSSTPPPAAGHDTPGAATVGFLQGATGGDATATCGYVLPAQTSVCTSAFSSGGALSVRHLALGKVTVSGDRALVTALGELCTGTGTEQCFTSSDPAAGQPTEALSFDAAYRAVEDGTSADPNDPAVPCQSVDGRWYVDLGQTSSGASSQPTPSG